MILTANHRIAHVSTQIGHITIFTLSEENINFSAFVYMCNLIKMILKTHLNGRLSLILN